MTEPTREPTFSENFFEDTEMSGYKDVKIILSDEPMRPRYHLHKVILAAQSSFFHKLFYHEPKDVYEIGAVSKGGFEAIIDIMYGQRTLRYTDYFPDCVTTRELPTRNEISRHVTTRAFEWGAGPGSWTWELDLELWDTALYLGCQLPTDAVFM